MEAETNVFVSEMPDPNALIKQFKNCGQRGDYWNRIRLAEDTRLARWDGQSDDGKKHDKNLPDGKPAFPFEGASDVRCFQSDEVVNENVAIKCAAFWRAEVRALGVEVGDSGAASNATTYLEWLTHNRLAQRLDEEVELSAQWEEWYGWSGAHISWEREIAYKPKTVTMDELQQFTQQLSQIPQEQIPPDKAQLLSALSSFYQLVLDPTLEDQAVAVTQFLYTAFASNNLPKDIEEEDIRQIGKAKARKIVRSLRNTGEAELPMPYLCKNQPCITALKPWRDIVIPPETCDIQSARVIFIRRFMSEVELRAQVASDNWDAEWVEQAIKTKGRTTVWNYADTATMSVGQYAWAYEDQRTELIEVLYAYQKQVDELGIAQVTYTVLSAHIMSDGGDRNDLVAKFGPLNYPEITGYPVVIFRRERLDRQVMASRGTPEILLTSQAEEKTQRDALADLTSLAVLPPLNIPKGSMGARYRFGPAVQNEINPQRPPMFMDIPTRGAPLSLDLIELIQRRVNRYFARFSADIPPSLTQARLAPMVKGFLMGWAECLRQAYALALKFSPEMVARVTGGDPSEIQTDTTLDFILHFDVTQLDHELMAEKIKAFNDLIPGDAAGVIDRAKLTQMIAAMIDPTMARQLLMDKGAASQKMFKDVGSDILGMFAGNEAQYGDASNDPSAPMKLQFAQQIIGKNPKYLMSLPPELVQQLGAQVPPQMAGQSQPDPIFSSLLENYLKNLKMGVDQQNNKQVGRIGVKQLAG